MFRGGSFRRSLSRPFTRMVLVLFFAGTLALDPSSLSAAPPTVDTLIEQLRRGVDFRVRVQAALELGKAKTSKVRAPLERALDDDNAAVRAAAAAALKVLGDDRALPALLKHKNDESTAVRAQIESSIAALRTPVKADNAKGPELLVQIGKIRNGSTVNSQSVEADVERTSREKIAGLPGIALLESGKNQQSKNGKKIPVVMVTGRVKHLQQKQEGASVTYSASVEFVLHKMPGQTITGVVSGSAKASSSASQMGDREAMDDLRRSALEAAIESAIRRAPPALRAAAE